MFYKDPGVLGSVLRKKSLTLFLFQSILLSVILVLAPQFYPRCIASKERKTERESESWLKLAVMVGEQLFMSQQKTVRMTSKNKQMRIIQL